MRVELAYGRGRLPVDLPDSAHVIEPRAMPGLDAATAIRSALVRPTSSEPLRALATGRDRIGVSVCDVTRPFPARVVLPVIFDEIGGDPGRITIFIATGTHRLCTDDELDEMLGPEIRGACRVVQHDASDEGRHSTLGLVPGSEVPVRVETEFLDQDLRITTGFIEPHFFAGFSGGPKMVVPGLCALETVLELHSATRIASPRATWGVTEGNPVHDAVREVAMRVGVDFNVDVTLNRNREITGVFAGDLFASHAAGCSFARSVAMIGVREPYDLVVGSNSGYPLDQNLYQTVKGMSAAAQIVKPGGTIVIAAQCADGFPEHGRYRKMLAESAGPSDFLAALPMSGQGRHDQWQVQIQAQIQLKARVMVKADGLSAESLKDAWLEPVADVTEVVSRSGATNIAVLPEGPLTIPYIA